MAFVGAGFSAPAVPTWDELLRRLGDNSPLSDEVRNTVTQLLGKSGDIGLFDREAAAQLIEEDLGERFFEELDNAMINDDEEGNKRVNTRTRLLNSIPFQSVITTNFDRHISGSSFTKTDIRSLLRPTNTGWAEGTNWLSGHHDRPIVKIHGDLSSTDRKVSDDPLVFSKLGYRKLLFEVPNYQAVVRSLLATRTILFLGFSFSDAYLNLLRSEILSMFGTDSSRSPAAYAVVNDLSEAESDYLLRQEGIKTISYDSNNPPNHRAFDLLLEQIVETTSADRVAADLLSEKNLLWFDPRPQNNQVATQILVPRIQMGRGTLQIETELPKAKEALDSDNYDLVISHWGHQLPTGENPNPDSNAQSLLKHIRSRAIVTPMIVFASGDYANANRKNALALGAFDFVFDFQSLFLAIERLFGEVEEW